MNPPIGSSKQKRRKIAALPKRVGVQTSPSSGLDQLLSIIILKIANYGVNVIGAALRSILDKDCGTLDAEISGASLGRRSTPREIGVAKLGFDLGHFHGRGIILCDVDPLAYH